MKKNLSVSAFACLVMIVIMRWQGTSLKTPWSPKGIVDLEFADTHARLNELLPHWDLSAVKINVWLDFLFIVTYVAFLSIAAEYGSIKWKEGFWQKAGLWLARTAYVAGVLDIAENLLMLQTLGGNFSGTSLQITFYCAATKFILAGLIVLYLIISLPVMMRKNKDR